MPFSDIFNLLMTFINRGYKGDLSCERGILMNLKIIPIELFFAVHIFLLGIILMLPTKTMSSVGHDLESILNQSDINFAMGLLCVVIGLVQFFLLLKKRDRHKALMLSINVFVYSYIGTIYLIFGLSNQSYDSRFIYIFVSGLVLWLAYTIRSQRVMNNDEHTSIQ